MRVKASSNSRDVPCPGCGLSTLLRGDTGRCEKCTAKSPAKRQEWADTREAAAPESFAVSKRVPAGTCIVCGEPYGDLSIRAHDKICPARPEVCECGKRYWTDGNLRAHQYNCKVHLSP